MFRFTIYKNSILASICSLFGTAFIALALLSMLNGELGILPGICVIAAGIGLVILAGEISQRKERRKKAKAAQTAAAAAGNPAAAPRPASPVRPAAAPRTATAPAKPLGNSVTAARVFCILTALCGFYAFYLYSAWDHNLLFDDRLPLVMMVEAIGYLLLMAGCSKEKISKLFAPALLGLAGFNAFVGGSIFADSLGGSALVPVFALKVLAYLLMAVFVLVIQHRDGGLPVALCFVPTVLLVIAGLKMAHGNFALDRILMAIQKQGITLTPRAEYPELCVHLLGAAALAIMGYNCHRLMPVFVPASQPVRQGMQINCPHCYQANSAESLFCESCGQKLTRPQPQAPGLCPHCHHQNSADSLFCQSCGQKLTKPQTPPPGLCPQCGHRNTAESRFCQNCGRSLP